MDWTPQAMPRTPAPPRRRWRPEGAQADSPGRRPGNPPPPHQALKGRPSQSPGHRPGFVVGNQLFRWFTANPGAWLIGEEGLPIRRPPPPSPERAPEPEPRAPPWVSRENIGGGCHIPQGVALGFQLPPLRGSRSAAPPPSPERAPKPEPRASPWVSGGQSVVQMVHRISRGVVDWGGGAPDPPPPPTKP
jgi:hypothetical protein